MAKKGLILSILGISLGICTGFLILYIEGFLEREMRDALQKEIHESSGCDFDVDNVVISLLTLRAKASNARIVCGKDDYLTFKKLSAVFSLKEIRDKRILLTNLKLTDGFSKGIGEDSPTYKFIDSITSPPPPERDIPGQWKIIMLQLQMSNVSFTEPFEDKSLEGINVSLTVKRTETGDFDLFPAAESLKFGGKEKLALGKLNAALHITDDHVIFEEATLEQPSYTLKAKAKSDRKNKNALSGDYTFLAGALASSGTIAGKLSHPKFTGNAELKEPIAGLPFQSLSADLTIERQEKGLFFKLDNLSGKGPNITLSQKEEIIADDGNLKGQLNYILNDFSYNGMLLSSAEGNIKIAGSIEDPKLQLDLSSSSPKINIQGSIYDIFEKENLKGDLTGNFNLPFREKFIDISLQGKFKDSKLDLELNDPPKQIINNISIDFKNGGKGKLTLAILNLAESPLSYIDKCLNLAAKLEYNFDSDAFKEGNGALAIDKFILGCEPHVLRGNTPINLPIKGGSLALSGLKLTGSDSSLLLNGAASLEKLDLSASGELDLKSFLSLFPNLDELKGHLFADLKLIGSPSEPLYTGSLEVKDARIDIEASDVSFSNIYGKAQLIKNYLNIKEMKGDFNGGKFEVSGNVNPLNLEKSELAVKFLNVFTSPLEGLNFELSGNLALANLNSPLPVIKGNIEVNRGEFQRNLELTRVITSIPKYILGRGQAERGSKSLPNMEIDLNISASRNIFIFTNWLNAELEGNLNAKGNLNQPEISGKVEVLNGWMGFKDRIFDINSGKLIFKPGQSEPYLEIISESFINSKTGINTQVILEATGSLSSPRISLTSDRALSEQELISLITSGSGLTNQTRKNSLQSKFDFSEERPDFRSLLMSPRSFFEFFTTLDSLSIEPTYNTLSGTVDPALVARKQILDRMYLEGTSFIGSSVNLSRAQIVYNLTPAVNVAGLIMSTTTRDQLGVEFNSTYTILSSQSKNLVISFEGNEQLSELSILNSMRINENSRVKCDRAGDLLDSVRDFYRKNGFFNAEVKVQTACDLLALAEIKFSINENKQSTIRHVIFSGDALGNIIDTADLSEDLADQAATESLLKDTEKIIIQSLRNEGYISARADVRYINSDAIDRKDIEINIFLGRPVTFTFVGNTAFSPKEFLDTINLFNRKLPLGSNTINLLVEAIEKKYRDAGYLYATISYKKADSSDERVNYQIIINEESKVKVKTVELVGNQKLTIERIKKLVLAKDSDTYKEVFLPKIVQAEVIESNKALLMAIYREEGFVNTEIEDSLVPGDEEDQMTIRYIIKEGEAQKSSWLNITGLPEGVAYKKESGEYSIEKANEIINDLLRKAQDRGFLTASFTSTFDAEKKEISVAFVPGTPTIVNTIEVEGNKRVSKETVLGQVLLKTGSPWDSNLILESRKKLFRLGLFTKVEITAKDGEADEASEDLIIRVTERPLQSLEVGAGANSELGTHIFAQATDRSLFKDGRSLSLISDLYYDPRESGISQGIAGLIYTHPDLLASDYTLTEDLRYQSLDTTTQEFDLNRASLGSYLYRTFNENLTFSTGHTILSEDLTDVSPDAIISDLDSGVVRLSYLSGFLTYDKRDLPLNPTKGYVLSLDYKVSSEAIGSEANFYALGAKASTIQPLDELNNRFSLAAASRAAGAWTFSDTDEVPITQRFYSGGRNSVRGFREFSLGPRGEFDSVIGGDLLFVNNIELRYLAADNTSLHSFFDAGTVFLQDRSVSLDDIRESAGIGVRFLSPIGPIGFDIAHPLDERSGEPSLRFHFNIGSNF